MFIAKDNMDIGPGYTLKIISKGIDVTWQGMT